MKNIVYRLILSDRAARAGFEGLCICCESLSFKSCKLLSSQGTVRDFHIQMFIDIIGLTFDKLKQKWLLKVCYTLYLLDIIEVCTFRLAMWLSISLRSAFIHEVNFIENFKLLDCCNSVKHFHHSKSQILNTYSNW